MSKHRGQEVRRRQLELEQFLLDAQTKSTAELEESGRKALRRATENPDMAIPMEVLHLIRISQQRQAPPKPLHRAVRRGDLVELQRLLSDHDVDIYASDEADRTALHRAAEHPKTDALKILLHEQRYDINYRNSENFTVLHSAAHFGRHEALKILLTDQTCNVVNLKTVEGYTPLAMAARNQNTLAVGSLLEDGRCDVNVLSNVGQTVLHLASHHRDYDMLTSLLCHPNITPSLTKIDDNGASAVDTLIRSFGNISKYQDPDYALGCVKLFAEHPVALTSSPFSLCLAVQFSSTDICEVLLQNGVDINSCFPEGESALHCAIRVDSFEKCKLLLKYGINLNMKWRSLDAFQYAIALSSTCETLQLLSSYYGNDHIKSNLGYLCYHGESAYDVARRLGVPSWFDDTQARNSSRTEQIKPLQSRSTFKTHKEITTTKIRPGASPSAARPLTRLISAAHAVNAQKEIHMAMKEMIQFFKVISSRLSSLKSVAHFAFNPYPAGSTKEGTKIFLCDEFDMICEFKDIGNLDISPRSITVHGPTPWSKYGEDKLNPRFIADDFRKALEEVLSGMFDSYNDQNPRRRIHLHRQSVVVGDKISCLQLLWKGSQYPNVVVYVDAVPAFLYGYDTEAFSTPVPYHVITKTSRHQYANQPDFSISHSCIENHTMKSLPAIIRHGYTMAKAMRIAKICQPKDNSHLQLHTPIHSDDVITSYMLKSSLLNILQNNRYDDTKNAYDWADDIYANIEERFTEGRMTAGEFPEIEYLFNCNHRSSYSGLSSCCFKRKIVLNLCKTIRQWLRNNRCAMYQWTYGRHLVYARKRGKASESLIAVLRNI